jgi:hypothetical protein
MKKLFLSFSTAGRAGIIFVALLLSVLLASAFPPLFFAFPLALVYSVIYMICDIFRKI